MFRLIILCLNYTIFLAYAIPADVRITTKKFQNSLTQQNLQSVLVSIEERLRNLDSIYSTQYSPSVEGKLEHYGRKLESVEVKISRLEAVLSNELDKISENISGKNFKDDILRDHVLRKIDSVYERINHRLVYAELKLEMTEKKLENKLDMVLARLEKIEDGITAKDSLLEEELTDIIAVIEDIKSSTDKIENKVVIVTKLINKTHSYNDNLIQSDRTTVSETIDVIDKHMKINLEEVKENLDTIAIRNENFTSAFTKEFKEELNTFANKVVDFHETSWKTYDRLEGALKSISLVSNLTRYEIQNGFRSLTVQLGKKPHPNMLSDSTKDYNILEELDKKIDSNFESIMLAQNLFLESCYRVQKDEAQLETKISEVLEKLIETFAEKTTLEPKDLKKIEQLIRNHDQNSRRVSQDLTNTIGDLLQKSNTNEQKVDRNLHLLKNNIEALYLLIQDKFDFDTSQAKINGIILVLKKLEDLLKINKQIRQQNYSINNEEIEELKQIIRQLQNTNNATSTVDSNEYAKNITIVLNRIESKINNTEYYFNNSFTESIVSKIGNLLVASIQDYYKMVYNQSNVSNKTVNMIRDPERERRINEIFSMPEVSGSVTENNITDQTGSTIIFREEPEINQNRNETSEENGKIIFPEDVVTSTNIQRKANCSEIDVRFGRMNCTGIASELNYTTNNRTNETLAIDVRFNPNVINNNLTREIFVNNLQSANATIPTTINNLDVTTKIEVNFTESSTDITTNQQNEDQMEYEYLNQDYEEN